MRTMLRLLATASLFFAASAHAQGGVPDAAELVQVSAAPATVPSGDRAEARITIRVREGWHINANPPSLDYMIPTEVSLDAAGGITIGKPVYPKAREQKLSFEDKPLRVYDREVEVRVPIVAVAGTAQGPVTVKGTVGFQACNDAMCLAPASIPFELAVTVKGVASGSPVPPQ
ncbi:MAG TPA: protein-disulfide reductase DsbD N-terminal domain-containing protein, partial [Candidatus Eisenbacteria bacterium]|nr:protein-disulfide reductase DsbD N-terminal domain-containing protein [Candidatus Eisenbacteria bacterium]